MKLQIVFVLMLLCVPGFSETHHHKSHRKGEMNRKFLDPKLDVRTFEEQFEEKDRDVVVFRKEILKATQVSEGETVVDLGAGTGAFLKGLSAKVGEAGRVIAVEISPAFVAHMRKRVVAERLKNTEVVLSSEVSTGLKDSSVDVIFCVDTYHHFEHPGKMLADIRRSLKTGGRFVVVDFEKTPKAREWIQSHIRLDRAGYETEIGAAGFRFLLKEAIPFKESFMLTFVK